MKMKLTQRDKWLLQGLFVFVGAVFLLFVVILPIRSDDHEWEMRYEIQEEQLGRIKRQAAALPELEQKYEQCQLELNEKQAEYYPLLDMHEIDGMLTGFVTAEGIMIRSLYMEKQVIQEKSGIAAVSVTMELAGSSERLNHLLESWERQLYGSRILYFSWENASETAEVSCETERVLHLQAAIWMYGKPVGMKHGSEEQGEET
ncbi:MAG: hypothetical protein ACI39W_09665 [Brotaphodocola sp.]